MERRRRRRQWFFHGRILRGRGQFWRRRRERKLVNTMKAKEFINQLDERRIADAISAAELKSSGEIRVFVSHRDVSSPLPEAARQFTQLAMDKTKHRNGVLIFVAPA